MQQRYILTIHLLEIVFANNEVITNTQIYISTNFNKLTPWQYNVTDFNGSIITCRHINFCAIFLHEKRLKHHP